MHSSFVHDAPVSSGSRSGRTDDLIQSKGREGALPAIARWAHKRDAERKKPDTRIRSMWLPSREVQKEAELMVMGVGEWSALGGCQPGKRPDGASRVEGCSVDWRTWWSHRCKHMCELMELST